MILIFRRGNFSWGLQVASSSVVECSRFPAFPTMNVSEIRKANNVGVLRESMVQLGALGTYGNKNGSLASVSAAVRPVVPQLLGGQNLLP